MKFTYLKPPARAAGRSFVLLLQHSALLCLLLFIGVNSFAQKKQPLITLNAKEAQLAEIFRQIRQQSGYSFLYDNASLAGSKPVTVNVVQRPLSEVLQMVLDEQPVTYTINKQTIILKPATITPVKRPVPTPGQPLEIKGRVTDARTKEPVIGASIAVVGSKTGMVTDVNGSFAFSVPQGTQLQISFMGYETRVTAPINTGGGYAFQLNASQQSIKDVVVTGIFARPKQNFTGAASSLQQKI
ncbi:carboxypeptidase-like regulatory domain-containing protein [Chitinophaga sedimenti]|uniref:STN domain-containing protein n=1 Tax=Chitinophaga sedimenti TaxID=2033606 RepID=UPI002005F870|nr:STN domain-containing protein [Chitinophaga sedimenti]MCK7558219.1 carboxypeptidase-like regulatory domain-containing protein [Chitinophaga sedimenti]